MKIEKYKKLKSGKYMLYFDDGRCFESYEDSILKYELLLKHDIDDEILDRVREFDKELEVYYAGLKFIKTRTRSSKEVNDKLYKLGYSTNYIENAITKLTTQGYINDLFYAKGYLHTQIVTTSWGPNRIRNELVKKGVSSVIIDEVMLEYTSGEELVKIKKIVAIKIKANRNRGNYALKQKIMTDLITQGFSKDLINKVISESDFGSDEEIAKNEYEKLYKKLSRKYTGNQLELKIREKMYQKGLTYGK